MIQLGKHSYNYGVQRGTANNVIVGNYTSIAEGVRFDGGFQHRSDWISTFPFQSIWSELPSNIITPRDIIIGSDVWIGEGAIIFEGVVIGSGAIIGCNTVVKKNVPAYAVVAGAPMKILKYRYTPEQIEKLLKIRWWDWSDDKVRANMHLLQSSNIEDFIKMHIGLH